MSTISTLSDFTQSGESQIIEVATNGSSFSDAQTYCLLLIVCVVLFFIYSLIKTFILKSCSGCKRLMQCEKDIAELKTTNKISKELVEALRPLKDKEI